MGVSNGRVGGAGLAVSSGRWVEQGWTCAYACTLLFKDVTADSIV